MKLVELTRWKSERAISLVEQPRWNFERAMKLIERPRWSSGCTFKRIERAMRLVEQPRCNFEQPRWDFGHSTKHLEASRWNFEPSTRLVEYSTKKIERSMRVIARSSGFIDASEEHSAASASLASGELGLVETVSSPTAIAIEQEDRKMKLLEPWEKLMSRLAGLVERCSPGALRATSGEWDVECGFRTNVALASHSYVPLRAGEGISE